MSHLMMFHSVHALTPAMGAVFLSKSERTSPKIFSSCSMLAAVHLIFCRRCCGGTVSYFSKFSQILMKSLLVFLSVARPLIVKYWRNSLLHFESSGLRTNGRSMNFFLSMVNILSFESVFKKLLHAGT